MFLPALRKFTVLTQKTGDTHPRVCDLFFIFTFVHIFFNKPALPSEAISLARVC
jgi:hypothetical protein